MENKKHFITTHASVLRIHSRLELKEVVSSATINGLLEKKFLYLNKIWQ